MTCMICLEPLAARRGALDCKHAFCMCCIGKWVCTSNLCPVCRSPSAWIQQRKHPDPERLSVKDEVIERHWPPQF
jgi:hypothetical protein